MLRTCTSVYNSALVSPSLYLGFRMPNGLVTIAVTAIRQLEGAEPLLQPYGYPLHSAPFTLVLLAAATKKGYPLLLRYGYPLHSAPFTLVLVAAAAVATVATLRQLELLPLLLVAMAVIVHLPYRHHKRHT